MTVAERKLWFVLRDRRFAKFKFRRQVPIGRFIADFVCFERHLVIEVDGGRRANSVLSDQRRDRWFAANGYRVLRFWNNEVMKNIDGVATLLAETLDVKDRRRYYQRTQAFSCRRRKTCRYSRKFSAPASRS